MSNDLVKSIGIALFGALLGMFGGVAKDRIAVENRDAATSAQVSAFNQRLDNLQADIREIRELLMQRHAGK